MIARCAIVRPISAPNAKMPTRKSRSSGITSAPASADAIAMTTNGVERVGCRRPTALGICRLVASEYASRDRPSIAEFAPAMSVAVAAAATT